MKKLSFALAALLMFTALSAIAGPPPGAMTVADPSAYKGMTPDEIARAKKGELVILTKPESVSGRSMITAAMTFNQGIDTTWNLMIAGWRQQEYLPGLKSSKLIKKWDNRYDIIEMHVSILGIDIGYQILGDRDKTKYRSSWKLNPGFKNDMKQVTGFWQFYYLDDTHTFARYGTWVEFGSFIPNTVQEYMIKRNLPEALTAQKKFVDSNGTYKKPAGT